MEHGCYLISCSQHLRAFIRGCHFPLSDRQPYLKQGTGECIYPSIFGKNKVLEEVGMYSIAHYIENLQNTVADYVATHLFLTFARNQSGDGLTLLQ